MLSGAAFSALLVLALLVAFYTTYQRFANYDDEGYVLLSLQQFVHGHALYSNVFTQYGPFPFELWGAVYKLFFGGKVTPDSARVLVIVVWLATALLAGLTVQRITRSLALGLVGATVAFAGAQAIANETLYPGGLAGLLIVAIAATPVLIQGRRRVQMMLIGLLVAAALMTKINVGGAALLAICLALSASVPALVRRRRPLRAFVALGVLMPLVVISKDLDQGWAQNLALLIALPAAALGVVLTRDGPGRGAADEASGVGSFIIALLGGLIAIALIIIALGTSVGDLIHGVLIGPLSQPGEFTLPATVPTIAVDLAIFGLLIALWVSTRGGARRPLLSGTLRIIAALLMWLWISGTVPITLSPDPGPLGVCLPLAWLAALAPGGVEEAAGPSRFARVLWAALPTLGAIAVYPVASSQVAFASVAFVPAGGLILSDGLRELELWRHIRGGLDRARWRLAGRLAGWGLVAALGYQLLLQPAILNATSYGQLTSTPFAGMTEVHQPPEWTNAYASLVDVIRSHCDNFVTLPGMNSFYLWSGITPPTDLNATAWMELLSARQQRHIVQVISRIPRLCLVRNDSVLAFWISPPNPPLPMRPLVAYEESPRFTPIFQESGYEVMIRKG